MRTMRVVKVAGIALAACAVMSYVVMRLWNWLMPELFHLHSITWAQALGLLVLSKILLGGFHKHGGSRPAWKQKAWKNRMEQRWAAMTPEERERFQSGMRSRWDRCGWQPGKGRAREGAQMSPETAHIPR